MPHKTGKWLISGIILFSLALAGCGTKSHPLPAVTAQAMPCPRPLAPLMRPLDPDEQVCSKRNEDAKAASASAMLLYISDLVATVECYEGQVGK